jgi:hypothetical protein
MEQMCDFCFWCRLLDLVCAIHFSLFDLVLRNLNHDFWFRSRLLVFFGAEIFLYPTKIRFSHSFCCLVSVFGVAPQFFNSRALVFKSHPVCGQISCCRRDFILPLKVLVSTQERAACRVWCARARSCSLGATGLR